MLEYPVLAVNHAGWNVEWFSDKAEGWKVLSGPWPDKDYATNYCNTLKLTMPGIEFRVYEALKGVSNEV